MLGIVHARVKSFGRQGRTKEISLNTPKEIINMVKSDEVFRGLDRYRPQKQMTLM